MWFGRPGQLVKLPSPKRGIVGDPIVESSSLTLLSGRKRTQLAERSSRAWELPYKLLTEAEAGIFTGYYMRHHGRGPWTFISELDTNLLSPNQSSATAALGTTEGFAVSHGTIAPSTDYYYQAPQSLLWTLPASTPGTPPFVSLTWPGSAFGVPVIPNTSYATSARISGDSASFEVRLDMRWYTAAGSLISTSQWAPTTLSGSLSDYSYVSISGLSPATAAYVLIAPVAETMVNNGHISIDRLQFEIGPVATDWVPGFGVPRVSIVDMGRQYEWKGFHEVGKIFLQELD